MKSIIVEINDPDRALDLVLDVHFDFDPGFPDQTSGPPDAWEQGVGPTVDVGRVELVRGVVWLGPIGCEFRPPQNGRRVINDCIAEKYSSEIEEAVLDLCLAETT